MKKLKIIFSFLSLFLAITTFSFTKVIRANEIDKIGKFNSKASYLMDFNSGMVISSFNENKTYPIASMCKIMSLLLFFEGIDAKTLNLDEEITISENASSMGGSQAFLNANKNYKVQDLLKSIIISSANDSTVALAEKVAGSSDLFVDKMNEKAKSLEMKNTLFSNPTGLPKPNQYSSAKDVSIMFKELLKHKTYFKFSSIWMDEIKHNDGRITGLTNTNKLIKFYNGCDAGKTGFTNEARHCLASSAKRGGMRLISVVIGAENSKERFLEASTMFNYGFANYTNKIVVDSEKPLDLAVNVSGGKKDRLKVKPSNNYYIFSKKNEKQNIVINFEPNSKVKAPIKVGEIIGKLEIYKDNLKIDEVKVLSMENIDKQTYFDSLKDIAKNWKF